MKKAILIYILLILSSNSIEASDKARGMFVSFGVGPRVPLGIFSERVLLGYGFNLEMSYTDNEYLPIFIFGGVGFEQYPGSQDFYQGSDYSQYSTNLLPFHIGARYYLPPLMENIVLILPLVEVSASLTVFQNSHEFKPASLRNNFIEDGSKAGFSIGAGASMFLMEALASYHWYKDYQYLSFDLKVRIPMFVSI
ncbi:MAG: hypothetical protein GX452_12330 [Ignavibacteriales bacterium]|jgi:opacity protein-like surface antigen|nr:hypothetical protein [Ignavibacteriaceae bacterium]NLH62178.1 hypothetical protein [Ignavibacteriales bacterium]HOJ17102.1 hypothetical protein [Ignavibacteriaceae bacterium]HPO56526.1 hypothetical protein [Ignavibacteriaceae bacterium]